MPGRQAKVLTNAALNRAVRAARQSTSPQRGEVIVLLSVKAGLRACEIARLEWEMVLDPNGRVSPTLEVRDTIAKKGSGRLVPVHPELAKALKALALSSPRTGPVIRSKRGGPMRPNSIV